MSTYLKIDRLLMREKGHPTLQCVSGCSPEEEGDGDDGIGHGIHGEHDHQGGNETPSAIPNNCEHREKQTASSGTDATLGN